MTHKYPLFWPYMDGAIKKAVDVTLKTRWLGQGPRVDDFERRVEKKFHRPFPLAVSSGSAALETAYDLVGIKPGDEVLVPILTCTATTIPLLRMGAKIKFIDVDPNTLSPDIEDILRKVSEKTKAVVTVDLGGIECGLESLRPEINVPVISDAAQSLGIFNGDYVCTSFQAIKFFTTGDGGMIWLPNQEEHAKAKLMRWFGIDRDKKRSENWQAYKEREMTFDIELLGYKRQMTDISATMGIWGLKAYDSIIRHRRAVWSVYNEELAGIPGITLLDAKSGRKNLCWLVTVLVAERDNFAKMLLAHGVETNLVQLRNDIFKVFGGRQEMPHMDFVEDKYLCLPINPKISTEDAYNICQFIKKGW